MSTIEAEPVDLTEHVFRSLRAWLHALFPGNDIFITRDESEQSTRPAFRLELVSGPTWEEATQGWNWLLLTVIVHYAAQQGDSVIYDVTRVAGKIRANSTRPRGRIPLQLYNFVWPQPPEILMPTNTGGTLPVDLQIAVAAIGADADASVPSEPVSVSVPVLATIGVRPRNWPSGAPLAVSWEIYAGTGDGLHLQGTVADGDVFEMSSYDDNGAAPPSNRRMHWRGIRVDGIDVATIDGDGTERIMDAAVTLRLRALCPLTTPAQMDPALT